MTRLAPCLVAFALVLAAAGSASAQPGSPPAGPGAAPAPAPTVEQRFGHVDRRGFLIGFSLGGGSFGLDGCDLCETVDGVALDIHIGGMVTPRLALMWDGYAVSDADDSGAITHAMNTAAAQYWVTPRVWIKGGLGIGRLTFSDEDGDVIAESESGLGVLMAAGVEIIQSEHFALDLQLRGAGVTYDENDTVSMGSLSLGFNWY